MTPYEIEAALADLDTKYHEWRNVLERATMIPEYFSRTAGTEEKKAFIALDSACSRIHAMHEEWVRSRRSATK